MHITELPTDSAVLIFKCLVDLDNKPSTISTGWTLAQVCTSWAKLVLHPSLTSIWSRLVFTDDLITKGLEEDTLAAIRKAIRAVGEGADREQHPYHEAFKAAMTVLHPRDGPRSYDSSPVGELLSITLKLSGSRPLSVSSEHSVPIPLSWTHHLAQYSSRWRDVDLLMEQTQVPAISNLNYPLLETLKIATFLKRPENTPAGVWSYEPSELAILSAPRLRQVSIRLIRLKGAMIALMGMIRVWFPWSRITRLELEGMFICLERNENRDEEGGAVPENLLPLSNLLFLRTEPILSRLSILHAPQLRHLVVVETTFKPAGASDHYNGFITVLQNSQCSLEFIEFCIPVKRYPNFSGPSICRLLEHTPGLRKMSFAVVESRSLASLDWEALGAVTSVQNIESLELRIGSSVEDSGGIAEDPDHQWVLSFLGMVLNHLVALKTLSLRFEDPVIQEAFRSAESLALLSRISERSVDTNTQY
ncbi:hypothetical protein V5O48_014250 [Marasmius crinis-equi]|uniref:F-box domain-containing protein n=1 Tax=Marasmius crinis-equi TaxID=585013 RepID=A0ABR3EXV2_9AGAR